MYHSQGTGQASKKEKEQTFWQEEKVHQTWGKCYGTETGQERSKTEKRRRTEEPCAFKKMSVSDSDHESMNSSSSEEGEESKLGSGELYNFDNNHSRKN